MNYIQYVNTALKLKTIPVTLSASTGLYSHKQINEDFFIVAVFLNWKRVDNVDLVLYLPEMECAINDIHGDLNLDLINFTSFQVPNTNVDFVHVQSMISSDYGVFRPTYKYIGFTANKGLFAVSFTYTTGFGSNKYFNLVNLNTDSFIDAYGLDSTARKLNFYFKGIFCKVVSPVDFVDGDQFKIFVDPYKNTFYVTGVLGNSAQNLARSDANYILEDGSYSVNMKIGGERTALISMFYNGK